MGSYQSEMVVGIDLGDRWGQVCWLDTESGEITEDRVAMKAKSLERYFGQRHPRLVAIEVGTHSPWISRTLEGLGIPVLVANARKLQLISRSDSKNDRADAELLARLAAVDPSLLSPIQHRSERAQAALAVLRARDALVKSRTAKVAHVRGAVKSFGSRLPKCSPACFPRKVREQIPHALCAALHPVIAAIDAETELVKGYDKKIVELCERGFPETRYLLQVHGVGPVTALTFVLVIEDPTRFRRSRQVGAFLGLRPRQHESGSVRKQLRITKAGDSLLRVLLVQCAHHILGHQGKDSDLRRSGLARAAAGGKYAKPKAVTAVARKLATLLHRLWADEAEYQPLRIKAAA